ncbi:TP901 family phage tail tape measure protein [Streptacidiphilus sp. MAP12-20]|uniref:phage tail tape measure protein n=1 Tax=Streptacidiphilus sp. MAP12-20 TaxID=3156299 RepID=UPI0035189075
MASEIGDLYVVLRAVTEPFKRSMKEASVQGEASTSSIGGAFKKLASIGMVAGGAAIAIGVASVKWAADFQTQMTRLFTAAGLTNGMLKQAGMTSGQLDDQVLKLGNQVGMTGQQMAEALYHPISAGLDLKSALQVVKYAAQEAQISGASLDDTTYSLSSVMKAFNLSAAQAGPTMASLNAIVGEGDMRFQDFNVSVKNWAPTAAQMGISINSMGAALGYLTDRGNSAEEASTRLTMGLSMMTTPSAKATKMLVALGVASTDVKASSSAMEAAMKKAGITQNQLAMDLKKPDGIYVALNDLRQSLNRAGVSGTEADSVLAKIFGGGRSDKAIMSLMQNLDGLKGKFDKVNADASMSKFGSEWAKAQQTFGVQLKQTEAALVNMGIKLGTVLMPYVQAFLGWVQKGVAWLSQHKGAVIALAGALGTALVAAIIAVGGAMATALGPELAIAAGVMAVGAALVYAYSHFRTFRTVVNEVGKFLGGAFKVAWQVAGAVIHWFSTTVLPFLKSAISAVFSWFDGHKGSFSGAWNSLVKTVHGLVVWLDKNVLSWIKARIADLTAWWHEHSQQIAQIWGVVWKIIETAFKVVWDGAIKPGLAILMAVWKVVWGVIKDTIKVVWAAISGVITFAMHLVMNTIGLVLDVITGKWGKVWGDLKKLVGQAFGDMLNLIGNVTAKFGTLLWDAGANIIKGLISGIKSMIGGIGNAMGDVGKTIRSFLPFSPAKQGPLSGSGSPDIAGAKIGQMVADGLTSSTRHVARAGHLLAGTAAMAISGSGGGFGMLAIGGGMAAANSGAGGQLPPIVVNVDGHQLFEILQAQALRNGRRNPTTGLVYKGR